MSERIIDSDGAPITVGTRVYCGAQGTDEADLYATIVQISDPDGDVDEGRMVYWPPRVYVRYTDGQTEDFVTTWTAAGPWDEDAPHQCDDVTVAA